ncbi:MAG: GNAT family N-acetyltransferase [Planctomycetota bacterium]
MMNDGNLRFRAEPGADGCEIVREITMSSGYFNEEEVEVAVSLVAERLEKGEASGYYFRFAERDGRAVGYTTFGPIAGTDQRYDLYWIAVAEEERGTGIGKVLLKETEQAILAAGGARIFVETSSRPDYVSTRRFYEATGYSHVVTIEGFYRKGDGKALYVKILRED